MSHVTNLKLAVFFGLIALRAAAGVTIHYSGEATDAAAVDKILATARDFAARHRWKVEDASAEVGELHRMKGEQEETYRTKVRGLCIRVATKCEPFYLQFGEDGSLCDFVKTQFAGADAHIGIIDLLTKIQPLFKSMEVYDEGEYWETHNKITLLRNLEAVDLMIARAKSEHPKVKGPIILANGRIIDLMD